MFVNFARDVAFVRGARRSALYDLRERRIFSVDADGTTLLARLAAGLDVDALLEERPDARPFVDVLRRRGLIAIDDAPRDHNAHLAAPSAGRAPSIGWIELSTGCNHQCTHCYSFSGPAVTAAPDVAILRSAIEQLRAIGCPLIKFVGGEPLVHRHELRELIAFAAAGGEVAVHTNATLIDDAWLTIFRRHDVAVDVTVYGHRADVHDGVTRTAGSFEATMGGLDALATRGCRGSVNLIVTPDAEADLREIRTFFRARYPGFPFAYDYLRPSGRGVRMYEQLTLEHLNRYREHETEFAGVSREEFLERHAFNPCLVDKISIDARGNVFPCIMLRAPCGSLRERPLTEIIEGAEFATYRRLTLEDVEVCRDCEFRYACTDCRPIPLGLRRGLHAKPPECRYDPYTGTMTKESHDA